MVTDVGVDEMGWICSQSAGTKIQGAGRMTSLPRLHMFQMIWNMKNHSTPKIKTEWNYSPLDTLRKLAHAPGDMYRIKIPALIVQIQKHRYQRKSTRKPSEK